MKNGAGDPLTTKTGRRGEDLSRPVKNFCSVPIVLMGGYISPFWQGTVGEVNLQCRQAGRQAGPTISLFI